MFEPTQRQREEVQGALRALLGRTNHDAFVIVSVEGSDDYVQFALNTQGLFLDLPTIPLSSEQLNRAQRLFGAKGISLEEMEMFDPSTGEPSGTMKTFQVELKDDAAAATELAFQVLREVYQPPRGTTLEIMEN